MLANSPKNNLGMESFQACFAIFCVKNWEKELPKWFVAKCNSMLSLDSVNGVPMTPALLLEMQKTNNRKQSERIKQPEASTQKVQNHAK